MDIDEKLDSLTEYELKNVIRWTLNDLNNAGHNLKLNGFVRGWCRMLHEAVTYQINKAIQRLNNEEE